MKLKKVKSKQFLEHFNVLSSCWYRHLAYWEFQLAFTIWFACWRDCCRCSFWGRCTWCWCGWWWFTQITNTSLAALSINKTHSVLQMSKDYYFCDLTQQFSHEFILKYQNKKSYSENTSIGIVIASLTSRIKDENLDCFLCYRWISVWKRLNYIKCEESVQPFCFTTNFCCRYRTLYCGRGFKGWYRNVLLVIILKIRTKCYGRNKNQLLLPLLIN